MSERNYLRVGDKVLLKSGEVITVKSLEFRHIVAEEVSGYIPKSKINKILEPPQ